MGDEMKKLILSVICLSISVMACGDASGKFSQAIPADCDISRTFPNGHGITRTV